MTTNFDLQDDLGDNSKPESKAIVPNCPADTLQLSSAEVEIVVDDLNKIRDLIRICLDSAIFTSSQRLGKISEEEKFITPLKNVIEITKNLKSFLTNEA